MLSSIIASTPELSNIKGNIGEVGATFTVRTLTLVVDAQPFLC